VVADSNLSTELGAVVAACECAALGVIGGLRLRLIETYDAEIANELIIGLILRYRCIGGFDSNQHASVARVWGTRFPNALECFASPLNHVFGNYFSVFEEDSLFGSNGNFLAFIDSKRGVLPDGVYEMNPPFEETILDRASDIVCETFDAEHRDCMVKLVMFVPNWTDSSFFTKLQSLLHGMSGHASQDAVRLRYDHVSEIQPVVASFMFVFVGAGYEDADALDFINECRRLINPAVVDTTDTRSAFETLDRVVDLLEF
jgi:hypothetical protein